VVHVCNPSYRRQKSGGSWFKTSPGKIVQETLSQKNPSQKKAGGLTQGVGPEFKPQYRKKKKKKR
jgi:hypothetical protein